MGRMAMSPVTTLVVRMRLLLAALQPLGEAGPSVHTGSAGVPHGPGSLCHLPPRRRRGSRVDLEDRRHGSNCSR